MNGPLAKKKLSSACMSMYVCFWGEGRGGWISQYYLLNKKIAYCFFEISPKDAEKLGKFTNLVLIHVNSRVGVRTASKKHA